MTAAIPTEIIEAILSLGNNPEAAKNRLVCQRWNSVLCGIFERRTMRVPMPSIYVYPPWRFELCDSVPSFFEIDLYTFVHEKLKYAGSKKACHIDPKYDDFVDAIMRFQRCKSIRSLEIAAYCFKKNIPSSDLVERLVAIPRTLDIKHITVSVDSHQNELELAVLYRMIEETPRLETFRMIRFLNPHPIDGFEKFHKACLDHRRLRKFGFPVMKRTVQQQYRQLMIMLHSARTRALVYEFRHDRKEDIVLDRYFAYSPHMCQTTCSVFMGKVWVLVYEKAPREPMVFFVIRYGGSVGVLTVSKIEEAVEFHECIVEQWTHRALSDIVGWSVSSRIEIKIVRCSGYFFRLKMSCENLIWAAANVSPDVVERVCRAARSRLNNSLHKSFALEIARTWKESPESGLEEEAPAMLAKYREYAVPALQRHYYIDRELYAASLK